MISIIFFETVFELISTPFIASLSISVRSPFNVIAGFVATASDFLMLSSNWLQSSSGVI